METIIKYLNQLNANLESHGNSNLAFRGHSNEKWDIRSSAARRLEDNFRIKNCRIKNENEKKKLSEYHKSDFVEYHKIFLEEARQYGYSHQGELKRELFDLELLALLQHNGAATCLIDFTKNFLVALWFASEPAYDEVKRRDGGEECLNVADEEKDGRVYFINLNDPEIGKYYKHVNSINYSDDIGTLLYYEMGLSHETGKEYDNVNKSEAAFHKRRRHKITKAFRANQSYYWVWDPEIVTSRIHSQNSIFFFSINPVNTEHFKKIKVLKEDKGKIRGELDEYFNINSLTIFRDFNGFAGKANHSKSELYKFSFSGCYGVTKRYLDKKEYTRLIECALRAIDCIEDNKACTMIRTIKGHLCKKEVLVDLYYMLAEGEYGRYYNTDRSINVTSDLINAENHYRKSIDEGVKYNSERNIDSYYSLADIYYDKAYDVADINDDYLKDALKVIKEFQSTDGRCGVAYISAMELSVMIGDKDEYRQGVDSGKRVCDQMKSNEKRLFMFYEVIGNYVFGDDKDERVLGEEIEKFKKINFIFKYEDYENDIYWDLGDIKKWAEIKKIKLISDFAGYMSEEQVRWQSEYYSGTKF